MTFTRKLALASSTAAILLAAPAMAQDSTEIPAEYQSVPAEYADMALRTDGDGVETITRTRWIRHEATRDMAHPDDADAPHKYYHHQGYAPYPVTLDRETWLAECHARTQGLDRKKRGGVIGALLGAITGGIIGNRVWDSERLAGTLIGGGVGGLAGAAIGSAIDSRDRSDDYRYDCEAALDRYMTGASYPAGHMASRSMGGGYGPAYGYAPMMAYAPVVAYAPAYAYAPQQMTMIEMREEIPQQVIVRENVREEWYEEMGKERIIEEVPVPGTPSKLIPIKRQSGKMQPIKGN